jgi:hypothetical protein
MEGGKEMSQTDNEKIIQVDATKLRKLLVYHFSVQEIITLCADIQIEYQDLGGEGKEAKARELINLLIRTGRVNELVEHAAMKRPQVGWEQTYQQELVQVKEEAVQLQENIEFVNRDHELDSICKPGMPRFTLVDGAAGFGKTYLLHKVKEFYEHNQRELWKAAYIDLKQDPAMQSEDTSIAQLYIANAIIKQFASSSPMPVISAEVGEQGIVNMLVPFLIRQKADVLLLWDGVEVLSHSTSGWIKRLMYDLDQGLQRGNRKLRVVFSGRYISISDWGRGAHYPLQTISLSPFNSMTVYEMIGSIAKTLDIQPDRLYLSELTWHVLHISGGHPQGICRVLIKIAEAGFILPDIKHAIFEMKFQNGGQFGTLFQICIEPIIQTLVRDLRETLLDTFKKLSPIRRFDPEILTYLLQKNLIMTHDNQSGWDLIREMLRTHLISAPNQSERMFSDQIVRRMLAMQLQLNNKKLFNEINEKAQELFDKWACKRELVNTEVWRVAVIESLFHTLQLASQNKSASTLQNTLIERLNTYIVGTNDPRDLLQLKDALARDVELNDLISRYTGNNTMQILLDLVENQIRTLW